MKQPYEGEFGETLNAGAEKAGVQVIDVKALAGRRGQVILLDVRPQADYAASSRTLEGAARVSPLRHQWMDGFPKAGDYVLFPGAVNSAAGLELASLMVSKGFRNVSLLNVTLSDWEAAGLPTEEK